MKREKIFNLTLIFLIAFLCAGAASLPAPAAEPQEVAEEPALTSIEGNHVWTLTQERPFERGGSLRLRNDNGKIEVATWDKPLLSVRAVKRMRVRRDGFKFLWFHLGKKSPFKTVQEAENYFRQLKVQISGDARDVLVETEFPESKKNVNLGVDYEVYLPSEAAVNLRTSNGSVSLSGLRGGAVLHSANGKILCEDVRGPVVAVTSNGAISCQAVIGAMNLRTSNGKIELIHAEPLSASESITCRTSNGPIHLSLSPGNSFDLEADTSNGHVSTDFPVTMQGKSSSTHLSGKVGQGGAEVKLRTSNGSISIKSL